MTKGRGEKGKKGERTDTLWIRARGIGDESMAGPKFDLVFVLLPLDRIGLSAL